jgi:hypothetical protein
VEGITQFDGADGVPIYTNRPEQTAAEMAQNNGQLRGGGVVSVPTVVPPVPSSLRQQSSLPVRSFAPPAARSAANDINKRFDAQAKELRRTYGPKGQGNLARRLNELEGMRANALQGDAQNLTTQRGQSLQSGTIQRGQDMQYDASLRGQDMTLQGQQARGAADLAKAQADAAAKAAEQNREIDEAGLNDFRESLRTAYGDDTAMADTILTRILSGGKEQLGEITKLTGQDRAAAIERLRLEAEMANEFDAASVEGQKDSGLPRARGLRSPEITDSWVFGGNRGFIDSQKDWLKDWIPGVNPQVMYDDANRVAPAPKDLRARRVIEDNKKQER